jgi:lytic starch monooxygenase
MLRNFLATGGFLLSTTTPTVHGHGTVVSPRSRNSVDYLVGVNTPKDWPSNAGCANITGDACHNGQATFWYSQGCFIGCDECDHASGRRQVDLCGKGMVGTLPERYRSVNRASDFGSDQDIYKHNPWRAPGNAPTGGACGLAGGTPYPQEGPEAGDYTATVYAHHGMNGTALPPLDAGAGSVWARGTEAEVTFQISNNHGGGYSYRLCPAASALSEACFQANPLAFATEKQALYTANGTLFPIQGVFVTEGTTPPGSMWSMIPIPSTCLGPRCIPGPNDTDATPNKCLPNENRNMDGPCEPCPGTPGSDCSRCDNNCQSGAAAFPPHVPGFVGNRHDIAVRDVVKVPQGLAPGKYVLGFRYDCEATAQVWNSCSDITIVA